MRELKVMVVDHEERGRDATAALLSGRGHEVLKRREPGDLCADAKALDLDLVVISSPVQGATSIELLLSRMAEDNSPVPVVVVARSATTELMQILHRHPRARLLEREDLQALMVAVRAVEGWKPAHTYARQA